MTASRSFQKKFGRRVPVFGNGQPRKAPPVKQFLRVTLVLSGAVLAVVALMLLSLLWRISDVEVKGCERYSADYIEEFIEDEGIYEGNAMLAFDGFSVKSALREKMPLLRRISIFRGFGKVTVTVQEEEDVYFTCHNVNYYLIAADGMRVLNVASDGRAYREVNAIYLGLPEDTRVRVGESISYAYVPYEIDDGAEEIATYEVETGEAEETYAYVEECMEIILDSPLKDSLSGMELGSRRALSIVLDDHIVVRLGDPEDLRDKLERAAYLLDTTYADEVEAAGDTPIVLDVSSLQKNKFIVDAGYELPAWLGRE